MLFFQRGCFIFMLLCFDAVNGWAQWKNEARPTTQEVFIPRDSMRKYWIEMQQYKHFLWVGGGFNIGGFRTIDELNFMPKKTNDVYALRLRMARSLASEGFPTAYNREVALLYGKVYRRYRFMATASAGLSAFWGVRWLEERGMVSSPAAAGLRTTTTRGRFYESEHFFTVGLPMRAQAFYIFGKELAVGASIGTTLNVKKMSGDVMLTVLLGIN